MRLREQIPAAKVGSQGVHSLIDLNRLKLESIDLGKLPKDEALLKSIEVAQGRKISGYNLQFKGGAVRVICIKTAKLPENHPQVVKQQIGTTTYRVMKNHTVV